MVAIDAPARLRAVDRLFVKCAQRWRFLQIGSIIAIEGRGDYTKLLLRGGDTVLLDTPLREWEVTLPDHLFVRVHRSTILNMDEIERVEEWSNQCFHVYLKGRPEPYQMSRRQGLRLRR